MVSLKHLQIQALENPGEDDELPEIDEIVHEHSFVLIVQEGPIGYLLVGADSWEEILVASKTIEDQGIGVCWAIYESGTNALYADAHCVEIFGTKDLARSHVEDIVRQALSITSDQEFNYKFSHFALYDPSKMEQPKLSS